ncbi:MAG: DUF4783 domain-containing protein [Bacteroidota bacterium]
MTKFYLRWFVLILFCLIGWEVEAQDNVLDKFAQNLKAGNSGALASCFVDPVQINLDGESKSSDKNSSVSFLSNFMKSHPLQDFKYLHKGSAGELSYAIGKYTSGGDSYRVTVKTRGKLIEKVDFKKEN